MAIGIVGRKIGMSRVFTDDGASTPVTVIEVEPNSVTQVKTVESDGYNAIQVTVGERKAAKVNKAMAGHVSASSVVAGRLFKEFRFDEGQNTIKITAPSEEGADPVEEEREIQLGDQIQASRFADGDKVDVAGISKGKGFAGVIKRHNFSMQDATHGNSVSHRAPGSIGQNQTPGRVFKGKKMAGHMGNVKVTETNLEVVRVDVERGLLLVKGSVPGANGGNVVVTPAMKSRNKAA